MSLPNNKLVTLKKTLKTLDKNLSTLTSNNLNVVVKEIQDSIRDIVAAVTEMQQLQVIDRYPNEDDGMPDDGNACEVFGGQFVRVNQTAASGQVVTIEHRLGRVPQLAIQLNSSVRVLIGGDISTNVYPATETTVSVKLLGASGDTHIFILV